MASKMLGSETSFLGNCPQYFPHVITVICWIGCYSSLSMIGQNLMINDSVCCDSLQPISSTALCWHLQWEQQARAQRLSEQASSLAPKPKRGGEMAWFSLFLHVFNHGGIPPAPWTINFMSVHSWCQNGHSTLRGQYAYQLSCFKNITILIAVHAASCTFLHGYSRTATVALLMLQVL